MISIPLELGDVIRVGRFKNKKMTVKEIGVDEHGLPTVNGRGILKIRIEKLMPPKEPKQENNMNKPNKAKLDKMIAEALHSTDTQVKIKQKDKLWWIQQEETDECLNAVGFDSKEAAEHSALTKGYSFTGQEEINEVEPEILTSKIEKTKGVDKVETMKLDKEKEIKLEILRIARRVIKEELNKKSMNENDRIKPTELEKGKDYIYNHPDRSKGKLSIKFLRKSSDGFNYVFSNPEGAGSITMSGRDVQRNITNESFQKKNSITELEVTDPELVAKIEEMAALSQDFDRVKAELEKIKKRLDPLDREITKMMDEADAAGERAIETKNILITIKKKGNPAVEVAAYKERFEMLYSKVNGLMKKQSDEFWSATKKYKAIPTALAVQYKENRTNEAVTFTGTLRKIRDYFVNLSNKIYEIGKLVNDTLGDMHDLVGF